MKGILETALVLLTSASVVAISAGFILHTHKRGERLGAGGWFGLLTIGAPAVVVFVATLLGFK